MSEQLSPSSSATGASSSEALAESIPLRRALDQNEAVKDTVEQSAAELLVINAVLKQEIPEHVQTGDVAQALEKADALEAQIQETAGDLAQVNAALVQEIDERARLEHELQTTRVALAEALESSSD